ncbi:MAG: ParB/RepB/Spo0J family partition protein [Halanaerobiales bacterium]
MKYTKIAVNKIKVGTDQPRQEFDPERLEQLASSIREVGQLQPVIVKEESEDEYLLIAGERRLRAIRNNASREKIAAVIIERDLSEIDINQIQLVENLQREDLNPLERAQSLAKFIKRNDLTKTEASKKLGVPRTTLTEWLNILEVKPYYQQAVLDKDEPLTLSHITLATSLASRTGDPVKKNQLLDGVLDYNLSRRETKEIVELFYRYLHMDMEEAIAAILLKRKTSEGNKKVKEAAADNSNNNSTQFKKLLNSFNRTSQILETAMEMGIEPEEEKMELLLDEFLYIYQLLRIIIAEIKGLNLNQLMERIHSK